MNRQKYHRLPRSSILRNRQMRQFLVYPHRYLTPRNRLVKTESQRKHHLKKSVSARAVKHTQGKHPNYEKSPFPMCFTKSALTRLLNTVGKLPPESGAKGFSHKDKMGFDIIEFDEKGSARANSSVYSPDVGWSEERCNYYINKPDDKMKLWSGDLHSHQSIFCKPSQKSGKGLGDIGYVEEVFAQNEWMEYFFIPILTDTSTGKVTIHPWVCKRDNPVQLMIADLKVCPVKEFPEREYNPEWLKSLEPEADKKEQRCTEKQASVIIKYCNKSHDDYSAQWPINIKLFKKFFFCERVIPGKSKNGYNFLILLKELRIVIKLRDDFPDSAPCVFLYHNGTSRSFNGNSFWDEKSREFPELCLANLCVYAILQSSYS